MSAVLVVRAPAKRREDVAWLALDIAAQAGHRVRLATEDRKRSVVIEVFPNKRGPVRKACKIIQRGLAERGYDVRRK